MSARKLSQPYANFIFKLRCQTFRVMDAPSMDFQYSSTNICIWNAESRTQRACAISRLWLPLGRGFWNACKEHQTTPMQGRSRGSVLGRSGEVGLEPPTSGGATGPLQRVPAPKQGGDPRAINDVRENTKVVRSVKYGKLDIPVSIYLELLFPCFPNKTE